MTSDKARKAVKLEAELIIKNLIAEIKLPVMRTMAWTLHKAFKGLYEKNQHQYRSL